MEYHRLKNWTVIIGILVMCTWYMCTYSTEKVFSLSEPLIKTVEGIWRAQARQELNDLKRIMIDDIDSRRLNVNKLNELYAWSERNVATRRIGGVTSDIFVLQMPNMKVAWDRRYINTDNLGKFEAKNYEAYKIPALKEMREGIYDTNATMDMRWVNPNGDPELLEWIFVPNPDLVYMTDVENSFKSVILVARIKGSEIQQPFLHLKKLHEQVIYAEIGMSIMVFITGLLFIIAMWRATEHKLRCENGLTKGG